MRFNILVKHIFLNSRSAIQNLDFTFFSYTGGPKVDMCYSDFLLAEKQIERFGPNSFSHFLLAEKQIERFGLNPFSHFLLAEKQIEPFGEIVYPIPFTRHNWTLPPNPASFWSNTLLTVFEVPLLVAWSGVHGMYVIHNTPGSRYMSKVVRPENSLIMLQART